MTNKLQDKYNKLFDKLKKEDELHDNESAHIIQDNIYRQFIRDICNSKLEKIEDIKNIAKDINKNVITKDKGRWYA